MKKILLILLFVCSLFAAEIDDYAKEMNFHRDYTQALNEAKEAGKPLMLLIGADNCPWCRKLERRTIASKEIKARLDEVVTVVMDQNFDAKKFPAEFSSPRTPSIFFIDPKNGKHFRESVGYLKKNEFSALLDMVKKEFKK